MDVAQTLWGNLQKGHQTAVDHRGSGTLAGEDVTLKSNWIKKKKLSKKEKCLNSDDARYQILQNSIICLSHLTLQSTSVLLVTWVPKPLPVSQTNICKRCFEPISWPAVSENVIWEWTKSFCLPSSGPGVVVFVRPNPLLCYLHSRVHSQPNSYE